MRRLCQLLGMPQNRFASIHVVGTNGKTSVTRMTAALLEAHGVTTGAYVSPHITSWRERVLIRGEPISEEAFTQALERAEQAAEVADRTAGDEGPVTQFELLTAAAFVAFAAARVEYAVIEAGLGGRLDATNVIPSQLTVLTSVGYDHTEWLGETLEEIAAEKVAVLRDHTASDRGTSSRGGLAGGRAVRGHGATPVTHRRSSVVPGPSTYRDRNRALARPPPVGCSARWTRSDVPSLAPDGLIIPGRAQLVGGDPPEIFDAAHNPDGAQALAEVAAWSRRRSRSRLLPRHPRGQGRSRDRQRAGARGLPLRLHRDPAGADRGLGPARRTLAAGARGRRALREGGGGSRGDRRPARRLGAGTRTCQRAGRGRAGGRQPLPSVVDMDREARSELLTMMGLVAVVVAVVILVFFAFGYVFGLLFL